MTEALRPMSTGELLDRTFALFKRYFLLFAGIAAIAPAIYLVFQVLLASAGMLGGAPAASISKFGTAVVVGIIAAVVVIFIAYLLGLAITQAATIRAVSAVHLGRPMSIREAYAGLKGHFWRIVGVFLSVFIRVAGGSLLLYIASMTIAGMAIAASAILGTLATVVGVLVGIAAVVAGIVLALSLVVRYSLAIQSCIIEDIPVKQALKRSVFLAKGSRGRILTVIVLFVAIKMAIGFSFLFVMAALSAAVKSVPLATVLTGLLGFIVGVITDPLVAIALSLVYYDERVRKEAFDLQLMMAALDGPQANAAAPAAS